MRRSFGTAIAICLTTALAALLLVFAPVTARDQPVRAAPALWKIDGPRGDIYFFGSVHLLPQGLAWRTPALEAALKEAQRLVFEIDIDESQNMAAMTLLTLRYGMLPLDESLRAMLAPQHRKKLDEVATSLGMPPFMLDRMRPWLAAITLSTMAIVKQSTKPGEKADPAKAMDAAAGVDMQLWTWAKAAGKERAALETAEDQIRVFAELPRATEIELLIVTLEEVGKTPQAIAALTNAWLTGDTKTLDKVFNAEMDAFPVLRKAVLHDRHLKWLPQIEAMMRDGRTHVVVVGTAHLVGPDSVIAMLRAKGVKVEGP